jgi:pimeloyl-ACP methyl ester carboxylesterase
MTKLKTLLIGAGAVLLTLSAVAILTTAVAFAAQPARAAEKTVVLVQGAFADGSCWSKVIPLLQAEGLRVIAVQNPLSALAADVDATKRVIDAQSGPVILIGHSYGGVVITQVGVRTVIPAISTRRLSRWTKNST